MDDTALAEVQDRFKTKLQGVVRLGVDRIEFRDMLRTFPGDIPIDAYIIATEDSGKNTEHTHFLVESSGKLQIKKLRDWLKKCIISLGKEPQQWRNGDLNISSVRDIHKMTAYILKQQNVETKETLIVHNYPMGYISKMKEISFSKTNIGKQIADLRYQYQLGKIDLFQYGVEYRVIRNKAGQPDYNWQKELYRVVEANKTQKQIEEELRAFLFSFQ